MAAKTVRTYFEILEDTLLGYLIRPFRSSAGRQSISAAPKFYLFDVGVAGQVCGRRLTEVGGASFGRAFEVKGRVRRGDLRAMRAFREDFGPSRAIIVTAERDRRRIDGIDVVPYQDFLLELHAGDII